MISPVVTIDLVRETVETQRHLLHAMAALLEGYEGFAALVEEHGPAAIQPAAADIRSAVQGHRRFVAQALAETLEHLARFDVLTPDGAPHGHC